MANESMRKASHIGLWIGLICIAGWLIWSATHTNTENNHYGSGTTPITLEEHNNGLINLKPCGAFFTFDTQQKKPEVKKK